MYSGLHVIMVLHLKINTSGSFSLYLPTFCHFSLTERYFSSFLPMAGEKYLSAEMKANPAPNIHITIIIMHL